jgi:hypothetical protein
MEIYKALMIKTYGLFAVICPVLSVAGFCPAVCIMRQPLVHLLAFGKKYFPLNGRTVVLTV